MLSDAELPVMREEIYQWKSLTGRKVDAESNTTLLAFVNSKEHNTTRKFLDDKNSHPI